ncbi:MAG: hypothetical protein KGI19_08685 [Thaumarchaeota archaeon]|nr:hypothetical protein [Nitrososphaerota archaeon]
MESTLPQNSNLQAGQAAGESSTSKGTELYHYAFFFTDIVGLSDPIGFTEDQASKIKVLNNLVKNTTAFSSSTDKIVLPTGDGLAVGFPKGDHLPLELAKELMIKLSKYNEDNPGLQFDIRVGLNSGVIKFVPDILDPTKNNVWGPGIIYARRVMDIGDEGHILATETYANAITSSSKEYKDIVKSLCSHKFKHNVEMEVYNVVSKKEKFGNQKWPKTMTQDILSRKEGEIGLFFHYDSVETELKLLDAEKHLFHHKIVRKFTNISQNPIETHFITMYGDVERPFDKLNFFGKDESNSALKYEINADDPMKKLITFSLNKKVLKNKSYVVTYEWDWEEPKRYFTLDLYANCDDFTISFIAPKSYDANFKLTKRDQNGKVEVIEEKPVLESSSSPMKIKWKLKNRCINEQYRLDW